MPSSPYSAGSIRRNHSSRSRWAAVLIALGIAGLFVSLLLEWPLAVTIACAAGTVAGIAMAPKGSRDRSESGSDGWTDSDSGDSSGDSSSDGDGGGGDGGGGDG
jgi:hypothetical protein